MQENHMVIGDADEYEKAGDDETYSEREEAYEKHLLTDPVASWDLLVDCLDTAMFLSALHHAMVNADDESLARVREMFGVFARREAQRLAEIDGGELCLP